MSRNPRDHLPGVAFHITARVQLRSPWFLGLESDVEEVILEGVNTSDATLLAYAVMSNHFHIVLRQEARPLGWIMQPIMRRIAIRVQRKLGIGGHVFERRFRSSPCRDADYARAAIVYTNLNPSRAGLCSSPEDYAWCSHMRIIGKPRSISELNSTREALLLFANEPRTDLEYLRNCYLRYVAWRIAKDDHHRDGMPFVTPPPATNHGDTHFRESYCQVAAMVLRPTIDLRDRATILLARISPGVEITELRQRYLKRSQVPVRNEMIKRLLQEGYAGGRIADFFRISDSKTSQIAIAIRYGAQPKNMESKTWSGA